MPVRVGAEGGVLGVTSAHVSLCRCAHHGERGQAPCGLVVRKELAHSTKEREGNGRLMPTQVEAQIFSKFEASSATASSFLLPLAKIIQQH